MKLAIVLLYLVAGHLTVSAAPVSSTPTAITAQTDADSYRSLRPSPRPDWRRLSLANRVQKLPKLESPVSEADSTCRRKSGAADVYELNYMYQESYDSAVWYLNHCYDKKDSWRTILTYQGDVDNMGGDPNRFAASREYLKSILYLNKTDPQWYCQCVDAISATFRGPKGDDDNAGLAVIRYLLLSGKCPMDTAEFAIAYKNGRAYQREVWIDTAGMMEHKFQDTAEFPLDTTLPSLHDLGLDILTNPNASVHVSASGSPVLFTNLRVKENPFKRETSIEVELGETAYIRFDVVNVLGAIVYGEEAGKVYEPGSHTFSFSLGDRPAGTYYAHFTTPTGETRTELALN